MVQQNEKRHKPLKIGSDTKSVGAFFHCDHRFLALLLIPRDTEIAVAQNAVCEKVERKDDYGICY